MRYININYVMQTRKALIYTLKLWREIDIM